VVAYGSVTDLTDQRASQVSLMESESRFRALTELSSDWYWEQDAQFRFVRLDGSLVNQAGRTGRSSLGKTRWEIGALNMTPEDWAAHRAVLEAHAEFRDLELSDVDYKGRPFWMSISGAPIVDAQGQFTGYRGVGRNITARKRAEEKITRLAFFDVLTGLPNRRLLTDRLQQALAVSARDRSAGALLFIDLDNFKDLNDSQGHDVGDLLLKEVATRIEGCVREVDTVARLGGDEFIVMLQSLGADRSQAAAQAEVVGQKILGALNQTYTLRSLEHHSTPSIGITLFEDHHQTVDELLKQADLAMYESKGAGRNTLRFFDPEMQALVAQRTALDSDLRLGLRRGELVLYYQPVVDAHRRITGVEALVRWRHPQKGLVPPMDFIPMAEQSGLILPLGDWVMETACLQLAQWSMHSTTAGLTMAVNVSARQFRRPDFVQRVESLLAKTGAQARLLKLELTESMLLSDVQDAVHKMTELGARGVKFSLDDFGTGYSSLTYLKMLPLEQLKIDQSFVRDVLTDPNDAAIARTVLALGQSFGLSVVAEGVETVGQLDFLLENGCTQFQGYLFGRPVPVEQLQLDDPAAYI
jgi:diguanylate cyclase (GGDEF)-like protein/PAS domain S-box-containing protein